MQRAMTGNAANQRLAPVFGLDGMRSNNSAVLWSDICGINVLFRVAYLSHMMLPRTNTSALARLLLETAM